MPAHIRSRSRLIVTLLVTTLAMTALLAYEAQQAARSHRVTAEGVLRDYATFASWELSRHSRQLLLDRMNHGIEAVRSAQRRGGIALVAHGAAACSPGCTNGLDVRAAFHVRLPVREVTWSLTPTPAMSAAVDRLIDEGLGDPENFTSPRSRPRRSTTGRPPSCGVRPSTVPTARRR